MIKSLCPILVSDNFAQHLSKQEAHEQVNIISAILFTITASSAQDTIEQKVSGRKNATAQLTKPYVILISADGFRYDYADKYKAANLIQFRQQGAAATSMIPSYPSVTFPNHYSIATGLYPSHHGLLYN